MSKLKPKGRYGCTANGSTEREGRAPDGVAWVDCISIVVGFDRIEDEPIADALPVVHAAVSALRINDDGFLEALSETERLTAITQT